MTAEQWVSVARDGGIATVTLDRPEARNALPRAGWERLHRVLEELGGDEEVRVVVITGVGDVFCAGDDIKEVARLMEEALAGRGSMMAVREITLLLQQVSLDIVRMPKPVIAAVNGWALGAGLELALICDFAYAAEEARLGFPEASIGMTITGGITYGISRLLPLPRAKELAFTARRITAREALALGLVNKVVPRAQLMEAVREVAREIMANSPVAVAMHKSSLQMGAESTLWHALQHETELILALLATQDMQEGARAFAEKRRPLFPGR
jgi:enoyl-CoA hydratase/carnithine racemase